MRMWLVDEDVISRWASDYQMSASPRGRYSDERPTSMKCVWAVASIFECTLERVTVRHSEGHSLRQTTTTLLRIDFLLKSDNRNPKDAEVTSPWQTLRAPFAWTHLDQLTSLLPLYFRVLFSGFEWLKARWVLIARSVWTTKAPVCQHPIMPWHPHAAIPRPRPALRDKDADLACAVETIFYSACLVYIWACSPVRLS